MQVRRRRSASLSPAWAEAGDVEERAQRLAALALGTAALADRYAAAVTRADDDAVTRVDLLRRTSALAAAALVDLASEPVPPATS